MNSHHLCFWKVWQLNPNFCSPHVWVSLSTTLNPQIAPPQAVCEYIWMVMNYVLQCCTHFFCLWITLTWKKNILLRDTHFHECTCLEMCGIIVLKNRAQLNIEKWSCLHSYLHMQMLELLRTTIPPRVACHYMLMVGEIIECRFKGHNYCWCNYSAKYLGYNCASSWST